MSKKNQSSTDDTLALLGGLALGLLGGAIAGLLLAPKSGDEIRADVNEFVKDLPDKLSDEFSNPNTRTREFIDRTRYNIENQVDKVKHDRDAGRLAKAKKAEEMASGGYDF